MIGPGPGLRVSPLPGRRTGSLAQWAGLVTRIELDRARRNKSRSRLQMNLTLSADSHRARAMMDRPGGPGRPAHSPADSECAGGPGPGPSRRPPLPGGCQCLWPGPRAASPASGTLVPHDIISYFRYWFTVLISFMIS
jgi:hypothetical protein